MRKLFFTSNTKHYHKENDKKFPNKIDDTNGIVEQLKQSLENYNSILYIAASPDDSEKVDSYSKLLFEGLKMSGINFENYNVLDNRTIQNATKYINNASVIFLSGGDTYIENEFFKKINLKLLLKNYEGVIIGQSAGSINMAEFVYNSPEEAENSEPIYFDGLGLSKINIEPHFILSTEGFDELKIYQRRHIIEESKKREIYALCDGSHIYEDDKSAIIYGETYLIKEGIISKICDNKCSLNIKNRELKRK